MGGLSSLFKSKSQTTTLEPMLTDEQKQAMSALSAIGQGGQSAYDLSGFNFDMSGLEDVGQGQLYNLLNSGTSTDMSTASKTLQDIANQQFNPDDPSSGYAAYARQVARAGKTASDALNREAAMTGSRFGTGIQRQKADLAAQQSDILASKLGELYSQGQQNKLAAASGLADIAGLQENINQNRIAAAYSYGTRQRDLQNQKAQLAYDEWQRGRNEKLNALGSVMGANVQWGVKSATTKSPSTFMSMLGEFMPAVGSYNTHKYGYTTNQTNIKDTMSELAKMIAGGL